MGLLDKMLGAMKYDDEEDYEDDGYYDDDYDALSRMLIWLSFCIARHIMDLCKVVMD